VKDEGPDKRRRHREKSHHPAEECTPAHSVSSPEHRRDDRDTKHKDRRRGEARTSRSHGTHPAPREVSPRGPPRPRPGGTSRGSHSQRRRRPSQPPAGSSVPVSARRRFCSAAESP
jgi:hypothetical protein